MTEFKVGETWLAEAPDILCEDPEGRQRRILVTCEGFTTLPNLHDSHTIERPPVPPRARF